MGKSLANKDQGAMDGSGGAENIGIEDRPDVSAGACGIAAAEAVPATVRVHGLENLFAPAVVDDQRKLLHQLRILYPKDIIMAITVWSKGIRDDELLGRQHFYIHWNYRA